MLLLFAYTLFALFSCCRGSMMDSIQINEVLPREPGIVTEQDGPIMLQNVMKNIKQFLGGEPAKIVRIGTAYSNVVYMFEIDGNRYIYKVFQEFDEQDEMINSIIGGERVIESNSEFRIEKCLEGRHAIIKRDLKRIASELRKFHDTRIEGVRSYEEMVKIMLVKCIGEMIREDEKEEISLSCVEENIRKIRSSCEAVLSDSDRIIWILTKVRDKVFGIPRGDFKEVMCHNDLQPGNILVSEPSVVFIDFEFAAMGSPVIDIANLFCESGYDYSRYMFVDSCFPSTEEQMEFIQEYMGDSRDCLEIVELVNGAMAYSHFLWYLWAQCNKRCGSSEHFDYVKYGNSRLLELRKRGFVSASEYEVLRMDERR
ncbi:choline/ethanolamine kinase [Encephalitozoon hellem]|nr:choline/ethanolamine kinase [Encephalitozoon hellem]